MVPPFVNNPKKLYKFYENLNGPPFRCNLFEQVFNQIVPQDFLQKKSFNSTFKRYASDRSIYRKKKYIFKNDSSKLDEKYQF